jgi:hypothetical protein
MPVLLSVAMLRTINECFGLGLDIEYQGINVADAASGAGGDITAKKDGTVLLTIEITERSISRGRVVSTFNTKISPNKLDDYLFFYTIAEPAKEAIIAARKYFAQGHDINFVSVRDWAITTMTTIGPKCRSQFTSNCVELLRAKGIPSAMKLTWNEQVSAIIT